MYFYISFILFLPIGLSTISPSDVIVTLFSNILSTPIFIGCAVKQPTKQKQQSQASYTGTETNTQ